MTDVLAVFPHPDDETWIAGGILAQCVQNGLQVRVVSLTSGENGWDRTGAYSTSAQMAEVRAAEFHAACDALGVKDRAVLTFADGALDASEVSAWFTSELADCQPRLVVTFGEDGGYGHLDHVATFDALAQCISDVESPPTWLTALVADGRSAKVWRSLQKLRTSTPIVTDDFPARRKRAVGRPFQSVVLGEVAIERKREALRAHHSQLRAGDPMTFLDHRLITLLMAEETLAFQHGQPADFGAFVREITASA